MTKLDLHIHSYYSENLNGTRIFMPPSRSSPKDIIKVALKKGINVIAIADHDSVRGSLEAIKLAKQYDIVTIPSCEITSNDGHILAYNIQENIPSKLSAEETIDLVHKQGGVAVAPHPFNIKYSLKEDVVLKLSKKIFALEVYNSHSWTNDIVFPFAKKHNFAFTAGSDAHHLNEIGNCYFDTQETIESPEEILACIKKKKVTPHHVRNSSIPFEIMPNALSSFFYWKLRQIRKLFNPSIHMPYDHNRYQK